MTDYEVGIAVRVLIRSLTRSVTKVSAAEIAAIFMQMHALPNELRGVRREVAERRLHKQVQDVATFVLAASEFSSDEPAAQPIGR